jgi:hypothetical protein
VLNLVLPVVRQGAAAAGRGAATAGRGAARGGAAAGRGLARAATRGGGSVARRAGPARPGRGRGRHRPGGKAARGVQGVARGGRHPGDRVGRQVDRARRGTAGRRTPARKALDRARQRGLPVGYGTGARPLAGGGPSSLAGGQPGHGGSADGGGDAVEAPPPPAGLAGPAGRGGAGAGRGAARAGRVAAGTVVRTVTRRFVPWPMRMLVRRRAGGAGRALRRALLAIVLVVLLLAVLVGGDVSTDAPTPEGGPLTAADVGAYAEATGIPEEAVAAYLSAADAYADGGVDWALLAGIGQRECHHGEYQGAGCNPRGTINFAGARGPMQFLGSTWRGSAGRYDLDVSGPPVCRSQGEEACEHTSGYGTDGDRNGIADPWDWFDATHSAARMLVANHVADDVRGALRSYNPSESYIDAVVEYADEYRDQVADIDTSGGGGGGTGGGVGCNPQGATTPPSGSSFEERLTTKTRHMLEETVGCFGRGGGVGCFAHRASGEHPLGRACDFMFARIGHLPDATQIDRGWQMAHWLQAHADELDVMYVIWQDQIWSVARQSEGWREYRRYPECEGRTTSTCRTQDHYDHVHVSVES